MSKMSMTQKYMIAVDVLDSQIQMAEDRVKQEATSDNKDGTQLWLDQLFQLRNGKVYMETMRDMIYGSKELIELDIEHTPNSMHSFFPIHINITPTIKPIANQTISVR